MKKQSFALLLALSLSTPSLAQNACFDLFRLGPIPSVSQALMLEQRYGIDSKAIELTPNLKIPVIRKMADHETLVPKLSPSRAIVRIAKNYDAVIVGGGPAGLTSALVLAQSGKSVLILERNPELGGLAMGSEIKGVRAGGGAAYSAGPDGRREYKIFQEIGLGQYKKKLTIEEPIDSYLWKGKLYKGIWEDHTLQHLPASFALFKYSLVKLAKAGAGGESGTLAHWADNMNMAELVRKMPDLVAADTKPEAKAVFAKFASDPTVPKNDPMKDVIELLDLYGRSALGGTSEKISARQFIDFYESELVTRYTGTLGTGTIAEALINKLRQYPNFEFRTSAPVMSTENTANGTSTIFVVNGVGHSVTAKSVIFAAPVTLAPKVVKGLKEQDPEKVEAINEIEMSDYAVHVVRVKGHPFRATYDTWSASGGDPTKPTDFILGRWQDPKINSYEGMREFEKDPVDDYGIISIYQPLGKSNPQNFERNNNLKMVEDAVTDMKRKLGPLVAESGQKIEVDLVESYRWPYSIHIVHPGYLAKIPVLSRPFGNIRFANNTVASPELETAMARAADEAKAVIESQK